MPKPTAAPPLLLALLVAVVVPAGARAQAEPAWVHLSPLAGAVAASVPGAGPRPAAALQLELSRSLPVGFGVTAGWLWPSSDRGAAELAGGWAEGTFAYRFRLRLRGYVAPYAGPLLGAALHDLEAPGAPSGEGRWLTRWHFGGRAGVDIPVGSGWPFVRVEIAFRHTPSTGDLGGSDVTTAMVGFRWSRPLL